MAPHGASPPSAATSAGSAPSCSTSTPWRGCARRRCRCRCPGSSTGAALQRIDAEAATQLSTLFRLWAGAGAGDALDGRRPPVRRAAGGRAHRRARRRPGLLAGAAGRAAPGQPRRPVRRGRHRLLRHLRGVAAVVGAGALQGAHQRLAACPRARRRCRWSARCRPASSNPAWSTTPAGGIEVAHVELSGQLVGDIGATLAKLHGAAGHGAAWSACRARG